VKRLLSTAPLQCPNSRVLDDLRPNAPSLHPEAIASIRILQVGRQHIWALTASLDVDIYSMRWRNARRRDEREDRKTQ